MIRVFLIDDHASFRHALAFLIDREDDLTVVGQAGSLAEARAHMPHCDVAVVDLRLPDGDGTELISEFTAAIPEGGVLVLTASSDRLVMARVVEAGALGVLHKSAAVDEIVAALRTVARGQALMAPRELLDMLVAARAERRRLDEAAQRVARLTVRERQILQAFADGLTNKQVAAALSITLETQRTHSANILRKLEARSQLQALVFALRHGVVTLDRPEANPVAHACAPPAGPASPAVARSSLRSR